MSYYNSFSDSLKSLVIISKVHNNQVMDGSSKSASSTVIKLQQALPPEHKELRRKKNGAEASGSQAVLNFDSSQLCPPRMKGRQKKTAAAGKVFISNGFSTRNYARRRTKSRRKKASTSEPESSF
jgi:hypothetical protein